MSSIHVLPTALVNMIAAGEVIERPASVVKELLENALDAGAHRIEIVVEDGGKRLISITDDGRGMAREDLRLAFTPHATSKIARGEDLFDIRTMGFRGEALASIASISHAHIRTRPWPAGADDDDAPDHQAGWELSASGAGEAPGEPKPCPAAPGTTVLVRDLFHNTPARRKFLRSAGTELGHISEQLARVALPNPSVAFRLMHNGREVTNLPPVEDTARRIGDLFGEDLADALLPLAPRDGAVAVRGFAARPSAARSSAKWQYVFLNGRNVRDRLLSHAIREAYRGRLDPSRSPVVVIFLDVAPDEVDVNVHPTKSEVRFRDGQSIHSAVLAALKDTLNRADLRPHAAASAELDAPADAGDDESSPSAPQGAPSDRGESLRKAMAEFFQSVPPSQPRFEFAPRSGGRNGGATPGRGAGTYRSQASGRPQRLAARPQTAPSMDVAESSDAAPGVFEPGPRSPQPTPDEAPSVPLAPPGPPTLQVHNAYLVSQTDEGLMIVDQHALHERILYNDFRRRLEADRLEGQRMLIPPTFRVTRGEAELLDRQTGLLASLGIEVEPFGPDSVAIQRFPTLLIERGVEPAAMLRELLDRLDEDAPTDAEQVLEAILAMMACKAAVKAGDPLSPEEIAELLGRANGQDKASACPHGRPTTLHLSLADLAREFHRT